MLTRRNKQVLVTLLLLTAALSLGWYLRPRLEPTVTLAAVGDVLFARGVGEQIEKHGSDWLFDEVRGTIQSADLAFCNLECTLSTGGVSRRRRFHFRADPKLAQSLHDSGFTIVSLANNHTLDYGRNSLIDTITAVQKADMVPIGAGRTRAAALKLQIIEKNGLKVGFLAYNDMPTDNVVRLPGRPTIAGLNLDELPAQIKSAKSKCDTLAVSFHWGVEYMKHPTQRQRTIAQTCIDNGADLILGHHPHVLQPVENYKGKPIIYSLGAFVWDITDLGADKSAVYMIELAKDTARVKRVIPTQSRECRPVLHPPGGDR